MCRLVMPQFYENEKAEEAGSETLKKKGVKYPNLILFLGLFFFILSCGIEASFQSQTFTFGLCGPHHLSPKQVWKTFPLTLTPGCLTHPHTKPRLPCWSLLWHLPGHEAPSAHPGHRHQPWVGSPQLQSHHVVVQVPGQRRPPGVHRRLESGDPLHRHGRHGLLRGHADRLRWGRGVRPGHDLRSPQATPGWLSRWTSRGSGTA